MHRLYWHVHPVAAAPLFLPILLVFACVLDAPLVVAHELHTHSRGPQGGLHTHELGVAITCASPPYYYLNGDHGGREWGLIASAFEKIGHPARALYLPVSDATVALNEGWVDAVWTCAGSEVRPRSESYLSEPLLPRHFVAISLSDNDIAIDSVADLRNKRVAVHTEVKAVVGKALKPIERDNPAFRILGNHMLLTLMLFTDRIDILVAEKSTFEYFQQRLPQSVHPERPLAYHTVFPKASPQLIFRDKVLRDEFNGAWRAVRDDDLSMQTNPRVELMPADVVDRKGVSHE